MHNPVKSSSSIPPRETFPFFVYRFLAPKSKLVEYTVGLTLWGREVKEVEAGLARYDQQLAAEADLNLVDTASTSTQQQDIGHVIITRVSEKVRSGNEL